MMARMSAIDAVYRDGVFRPLGGVNPGLRENQRVRLHVESVEGAASRDWLDEVRQVQRGILARRGPLPDSTPLIAEDRSRES